jgi:hypothetical protein
MRNGRNGKGRNGNSACGEASEIAPQLRTPLVNSAVTMKNGLCIKSYMPFKFAFDTDNENKTCEVHSMHEH